MNRVIALILLFLFSYVASLYAQVIISISSDSKHIPVNPQYIDSYTTVDTAKLIVTYSLMLINDIKDKEQDIQILQIGDKYAKSYSQLQYEGDSIYSAYAKKGAKGAPWFQKNIPPVEVYKNYLERRTSVSYRLFGVYPVFLYNDDYPVKIEWQLTGDKKIINSYNCQKATGTFRGRTYEAWFTPDIPIKEGPYKFGGLPGLILEISDTDKHYVYTCIGIERPKQTVPIKYWKWRYQEITREKLRDAVKRVYSNPYKYLQSNGVTLYLSDGDKEAAESISLPYNPIELE